MAQVVLEWNLNNILPRRVRRSRNRNRRNVNPDYSLSLDVSDFGSPLPVHEILLEPLQPPVWTETMPDGTLRRPRFVLIPTPPPLPTREMLIAASRSVNGYNVTPKPATTPQLHRGPSIYSLSSQVYHRTEDGISSGAQDSTDPDIVSPVTEEANSDPVGSEVSQQCIVCMDNRKISEFPSRSITSNCFHPSLTCCRCLEYSIASDHTSKMWNNIQCPQCYQRLSYEDVQQFADPNTFEHYDLLTTRQTLSSFPDFVWCSSCPSGQIHKVDSPTSCPAVTCKDCSSITCFNHRTPWHTGLSCQQYDKLLKRSTLTAFTSLIPRFSPSTTIGHTRSFSTSMPNAEGNNYTTTSSSSSSSTNLPSDPTIVRTATTSNRQDVIAKVKVYKQEQEASMRDIRRACKMCPGRGCGAQIFKIDGCKHMTCLKCTHEFCWGCGRDWFYGHKCWKVWRRG